jgi:hypothetical protein
LLRKLTYLFILIGSALHSQKYLQACGKILDGNVQTVYYDSILDKLVLHGAFNYAGGVSAKGMVTWDGVKFDSLGSGDKYATTWTKTFMIRYKNKLYTQFLDKYLYSYDYSTKLWQQIPGQFDANIRDATVHNGELFLVGDFTTVGNISVPYHLVKFNGISYDTIPRPDFTIVVWAVRSFKSELYIAGHFDPGAVHLPSPCIAKYNGTSWVTASPGLTIRGQEAYTLEIYKNKLFMSGVFDTINGDYCPGIAAWDGVKWHNPGGINFYNGLPGYALEMTIANDRLYLAGAFDSVGHKIKTKNMAVWNDSIWCGTPLLLNQMAGITNYKGSWYFSTGPYVYCDTVPQTMPSQWDTLGCFSKLIGNEGRLERDCFPAPPAATPEMAEGVYPNPFAEIVSFRLKEDFGETCNLKIINQLGQTVEVFQNMSTNADLDLSQYPTGMYLFLFHNGDNRKIYKILKE